MDLISTKVWRKGAWRCPDCLGQIRQMPDFPGGPATWRHYEPRKDWMNIKMAEQQPLWGEMEREPCKEDSCPCQTEGPDINGAGGKTR